MPTLQKINPPKTNTYQVTIAYTDGIRDYANVHDMTDPTASLPLQILVYTRDNNIELTIDNNSNAFKLEELARRRLFSADELEIFYQGTPSQRLRHLLDDLYWLHPDGCDNITKIDITKDGESFKLNVTDDDMRAIFRKLSAY
jgi:hypothetical protein